MRQGPFVRLDMSPYSFYRESNKWPRPFPPLASIPLRLSTTPMAFRRHDAINLEHFLSASSSSFSSCAIVVRWAREAIFFQILFLRKSLTSKGLVNVFIELDDDELNEEECSFRVCRLNSTYNTMKFKSEDLTMKEYCKNEKLKKWWSIDQEFKGKELKEESKI